MRAGERVRDDERRRSEEVRLRVRVDAPLEIAVAREHAGYHQVTLLDAACDVLRDGPLFPMQVVHPYPTR